MKNIAIALLAASLGYGFAAAQPAKAAGMEKKTVEKKEMKKAKMSTYKGTVEAMDVTAGKITVKDKKGVSMEMPLPSDAKIMKGGKKAMAADIMKGDMVQIMYEGEMANPMIKTIKVEKAPTKKEKMEKSSVKKEVMKPEKK